MASQSRVLRLYKETLRAASSFVDYNFRSYAVRSAKRRFREARHLTDEADITGRLEEASRELAMLRRQSSVNNMFSWSPVVVEETATSAGTK